MSQSWVCFVLIAHLESISGIYTDCGKFDRQATCTWVFATPNLWNFYELVLTDLQIPGDWEIGSGTNLQKALFF